MPPGNRWQERAQDQVSGSGPGIQELLDQPGGQLRVTGLLPGHHRFPEVVAVAAGEDQQPRARDEAGQLDGMLG
jgi:hypothetical protein